ncbi:dTMP kinase [Candidatus Parcubacteria bacterium]|nr:dTMP kinase [Candidatus Parcubacteria bacterium]
MRARYIVFDGIDGSGKGLQLKMLDKELRRRNLEKSVIFTREPGGTPFAEEIRHILLFNHLIKESTPFNNLLLFFAAREDLMHNLVFRALTKWHAVISDRGDSSTFAFQLYGEGWREMEGTFGFLRDKVFSSPLLPARGPDRYVFFDLPPEVAYRRMNDDALRQKNHFDLRDIEYHRRVREGFQDFAKRYPRGRPIFIDAEPDPDTVFRETWKVIAEELKIS